ILIGTSEHTADRYIHYVLKQPATSAINTLSLHDALPICKLRGIYASSGVFGPHSRTWRPRGPRQAHVPAAERGEGRWTLYMPDRSEEHTSELQSRGHLVCRLLLEKKKRQSTSAYRHQ